MGHWAEVIQPESLAPSARISARCW